MQFYHLKKKEWEKVKYSTKEVPLPRASHSAALSESYENMYIFGGYNNIKNQLSDLWKFNIENKKWTEIETTGDLPGTLK
jgi:hypothetical protein